MNTDDRDEARTKRIGDLVREAREESVTPGFADRVMRQIAAERRKPRIEPGRGRTLAPPLSFQFLRLAPIVLTVIAGLFVYNVWIAGGGRTTLQSALGLTPVTIEEAYSIAVVLLDGTGAPERSPE